MQIATLLLVATGMMVGWVARGAQPAPDALAAPPPAPPRIVYVSAPAAPPPSPPMRDDNEVEEEGGEDLGEVLARAQQQVPPPAPELPHNEIRGRCTDPSSGDASPGVTVVVAGPAIEGSRVAITDEHGEYLIPGLAAGSYLVTFYYAEVTVERDGIAVSSLSSSVLDQQIGPQSYVRPIETGRTFEDSFTGQIDEGVSFTGTSSLENTYYIDGAE
jgi:hypothetical protein